MELEIESWSSDLGFYRRPLLLAYITLPHLLTRSGILEMKTSKSFKVAKLSSFQPVLPTDWNSVLVFSFFPFHVLVMPDVPAWHSSPLGYQPDCTMRLRH